LKKQKNWVRKEENVKRSDPIFSARGGNPATYILHIYIRGYQKMESILKRNHEIS